MKTIIKAFVILLGVSVLFTGCASEETSPPDVQEPETIVETNTAMLYTNMYAGSQTSNFKTHSFEYTDELTVEKLAEGLTELTGLDFYITTQQQPDNDLNDIIIDWDANSTLIANLDGREQKEEFHFVDADSMRWFMMDCLWRTVMENLGYENIYYTMNGGSTLVFDELYPIKEFPSDLPYMGSAFFSSHANNQNGLIDNENDAFVLVEYIMKERGDTSTAIVADGINTIAGEQAYVFSSGDFSEDGQKFTAMYQYAVSQRGSIYYMDTLEGADWILVTGETNDDTDFSVFTDISSAEVRSFVEEVQADIVNEDWSSLAYKISYPISIGTKTFETAEEFEAYDIVSLLSDDFITSIAQTDCNNLFANYEGVMLGNGEIWISEMLNDDMSSQGLKVYVINP